MEITKLSTKGQIVIPESMREDISTGTAFIVNRKNDLIILKKINDLSNEEIKEFEELQKIWKEIDEGKALTLSEKDFIKMLDSW